MNKLLEIIRMIQDMVPTFHYPSKGRVITLLDPGHGGVIDDLYVTAPGKMAKFDDFVFYEGVFNRALAWTYAMQLYERDLGFHMLVSNNEDQPLSDRVHNANRIMGYLNDHNKQCYFHSIHANAFSDPKVTGIEIFTSPGNTASDAIASVFYKYLVGMGWKMRSDYDDNDPDKEARFFVLTQTQMPAILTETGFYTNHTQAKLMRDYNTIEQIAQLFTAAHIKVLDTNYKNEKKIILPE